MTKAIMNKKSKRTKTRGAASMTEEILERSAKIVASMTKRKMKMKRKRVREVASMTEGDRTKFSKG